MDEEIGTLGKMGTWKLEDSPTDRKPIGCKWVYLRKRDEKGNIIKYKARLVAQGFSQKPGTDYNNDGIFAPVMPLKPYSPLQQSTTSSYANSTSKVLTCMADSMKPST